MATARSVLRALLLDQIANGEYTELTASALATAATLIVDTSLLNLPGGTDADAFLNFYALATNGNNDGEAKRVSAYATTGVITVAEAYSAAPSSGMTFELSQYSFVDIHNALNRGGELLYPYLSVPLRDETIMVDQRLANWDFETGTFTSWTAVGSPTVSAETSIFWQGTRGAKIVAGGAAGQLTQAPTINISKITDKTATFRCWVYATAANTARLRIDWDGSNFENHDYHSGEDRWELQEIVASIPSSATQVKAIVEVAASGTAYFDQSFLGIDPIYQYTLPAAFIRGVSSLSMQSSLHHPDGLFEPIDEWHFEEDSGTPYILLDKSLAPGRILRCIGQGVLSTTSSDTDTMEVNAPRTNVLIARAAQYLYETTWAESSMFSREFYEERAMFWKQRVSDLLSTPGMRSRRQAARSSPRYEHVS